MLCHALLVGGLAHQGSLHLFLLYARRRSPGREEDAGDGETREAAPRPPRKRKKAVASTAKGSSGLTSFTGTLLAVA